MKSDVVVFGHISLEVYPSLLHRVRYMEYMMVDWKQDLHKLTLKWRSTGQKTRVAATEIPNLLARGHMHGMSDGLDVAADDVDTLLDKPDPPIEPPDEK